MEYPHVRAHHRVVFPLRERPRFVYEDRSFEVLDCSQVSFRFYDGRQELPEQGTGISGRLRFARGYEVAVSGRVIRVTESGQVALELEGTRIPGATI